MPDASCSASAHPVPASSSQAVVDDPLEQSDSIATTQTVASLVWPTGPRTAAYGSTELRAEPMSGQVPDAGTVPGMSQGLASHILAGRRIAAIRGDGLPAQLDEPLAKVVRLPGLGSPDGEAFEPASSPRLHVPAAVLRVDAQMRVCAGGLCPVLGWDAGTHVVLQTAPDGRVLARRGVSGEQLEPSQHLAMLDSDRRLVLPSTVRAWLDVTASSQVAAVVCGDKLVLANAAVAWAAVAGGFAPVSEPAPAKRAASGPRRRAASRQVPV